MQAFFQVIIVTVMTKITSEDEIVSFVKFSVAFIYLKAKSAAAYKIGYDHFSNFSVKIMWSWTRFMLLAMMKLRY
jgi:hypothetical protein